MHVKGLFSEGEPSCLNLRKIEKVVDDREKVVSTLANRFGILALIGRKLALGQQIDHSHDAVHGCSQLVRGVGKKLFFELGGLAGQP